MARHGQTTLILGAGPAGLTAGYLLAKLGRRVLVLEAEDQVGGLSKTVVRDGYRFDLGGHRFFTKSPEVESLWLEVLGEELLLRPRLSRIYWNGRFLDYPLSARDVVRKLGPVELGRCIASYLATVPRRKGREQSLEEWVSNRFGRRLYDLFFRTYTEKVWGVPGSEIRAEWAAQRIKGLSLRTAAKDALLGGRDGGVKSLIREFHYPRYGPGQMWEDDGRADRGPRRRGRYRRAGRADPRRGREGRGGRGRQRDDPVRRRDLLPPAPRPGRDRAAGAAAGGARRGPRARVPRLPHGCARPPGRRPLPRTTGSTCTIPRCGWGASRTSAPGAPGWSRKPTEPASGSSTSASRATTCGTPATTGSSSSPPAS